MDTLDYTGPKINEGSKGVLLGLGDPVRELPQRVSVGGLPAGVHDARVFCPGCLVVDGAGVRRRARRRRRASRDIRRSQAWPLVVLSDEPLRATASAMNFLWTTFTRFEPAADIHAAAQQVRAPSRQLHAADPDRRAHEAVVPCRSRVRSRHRPPGVGAMGGVLPEPQDRDGRQQPRPPGSASRASRLGISRAGGSLTYAFCMT